MILPEKEWYSLEDACRSWGCSIDDLLHYAETKKLELCFRPSSRDQWKYFYVVYGAASKSSDGRFLEHGTGKPRLLGNTFWIPLRPIDTRLFCGERQHSVALSKANEIKGINLGRDIPEGMQLIGVRFLDENSDKPASLEVNMPDLFILKDEFTRFGDQATAPLDKPSGRVDKKREEILRILEAIKKADPKFDQANMPGLKEDFHALCKKLNGKLFNVASSTFNDYLGGVCKFNPGARKTDYYEKIAQKLG